MTNRFSLKIIYVLGILSVFNTVSFGTENVSVVTARANDFFREHKHTELVDTGNRSGCCTIFWGRPTVSVAASLKTIGNNPCPGKPEINPPCQKMQKKAYVFKINIDINTITVLPRWKFVPKKRGEKKDEQAIKAWNIMVNGGETDDGIHVEGIRGHETKHFGIRKELANQLRELEKTIFVVELCGNDIFNEKEYMKMWEAMFRTIVVGNCDAVVKRKDAELD